MKTIRYGLLMLVILSISLLPVSAENDTTDQGTTASPCDNVYCENYCSGSTWYYNGACDAETGACRYEQKECGETTITCPDGSAVSCKNPCYADKGCGRCEASCPERYNETDSTESNLIAEYEETGTTSQESVYQDSCSDIGGIYCDPEKNKCDGSLEQIGEGKYCCIGMCYPRVDGGYCGDGVCGVGEDMENCPKDCGCEPTKTCPDGKEVSCSMTSAGICSCEPCHVPEECYTTIDDSGFTHVVCKSYSIKCPEIKSEEKKKCIEAGGTPVIKQDPRGCDFVSCEFAQATATNQVFRQYECPPSEEIDRIMEKCEEMGQSGQIVFEGGCKIAKCVRESEKSCAEMPYEEKEKIKVQCQERGFGVVRGFDENGCAVLRCAETGKCAEEPPEEAYKKCHQEGGELIVKKDGSGCVIFVDCVKRGDENRVYVEKIEEVPDTGKLLEIAFKLEDLKIILDKLAKNTEDIANYYASVGSNEEQRFRRVSDMFEDAKEKVDEIKDRLRNMLEGITADDLMEMRHDIRYLKDVVIKDILYVMLSTSDEIQEMVSNKETKCTDQSCFDRALRMCKPVVFYPEGENGIKVEITGVENDKCRLYAAMPESAELPVDMPGIEAPYEMTCLIPDYTMGARNPETDIMPYCEGSLIQLMQAHSTAVATSMPEVQQASKGIYAGEAQKEVPAEEVTKKSEEEALKKTGIEIEPVQKESISKTYEDCSGCLDNGQCDMGECSWCTDCK